MRRMRELVSEVEHCYPSDQFFKGIDKILASSPQAMRIHMAYERAFRVLDPESWSELKSKALEHFLDHREGQLKQGFFNQLNEAFAYQHLLARGFKSVRMLRESGKKTPDIEYRDGNTLLSCEIKTLGISQEQIARREKNEAFFSPVYGELSPGFLKKLSSTIAKAQSQVLAHQHSGLVYLVVFFDDVLLMHYAAYRRQIKNAFNTVEVPYIYAKVGLLGRRRIEKRG